MVELTRHQDSIGNVLKEGNDLLNDGKVTPEEEKEIRMQMSLLNNRWEELRVKALERQSKYVDNNTTQWEEGGGIGLNAEQIETKWDKNPEMY